MNTKIPRIHQWDYVKKMNELISQSSIIKQEVFRNTIMRNELSYVKIKTYLNFINDFLKLWEDYAIDIQQKMSNCRGKENIRNIKYQDIKDFIYSNYDYAVIIPFIDNLYKQLKDNNIDKNDVNDYFTTTIAKAFDDLPTTVAGLIDYVSGRDSIIIDKRFITDKSEAKLFDSVKNYKKMFQTSDRIMLYKATQKSIEFITSEHVDINKSNIKAFVSIVNCIVEMITYSLVAYASRIYIISIYGYNFIDAGEIPVAVSESSDIPELSDSIPYEDIHIMSDIRDNIFNSIENRDEMYNSVSEFITAIGAKGDVDTEISINSGYPLDKYSVDNKFISKIKESGSMLWSLIYDYDFINVKGTQLKSVEEAIQKLKSILYNDKQGNGSITSPMQEYLHIIRGVNDDISTLPGCKETALDLAKTFCIFDKGINQHINAVTSIIHYDTNDFQGATTINEKKNLKECLRLLTELYSSLMLPILNRFKDLEILYNSLCRKDLDKVIKSTSLNIMPNIIKSVPDTVRMPLNLIDLYSLPSFEEYTMYDEYVKSLGFDDDIYFSEAFNISDIINKIMSIINGGLNNLANWYNNKSVKMAMKWIKDHQNELKSMDLTPYVGSKSFPYPSIAGKNLDLEKGCKNLFNNIKNFNPDDKNFDTEKFILSLYPSPVVKGWFDDKTGAQKYRTWILTNCDENKVGKDGKPLDEISLDENNVKIIMKECLDNCINIERIFSSLSSEKSKLDQEINNIKSKTVKATSNVNTSSVGSVDNKNNDNKSNTNQQSKDVNIESPGKNLNAILTQIELAVTRLWVPIPKIVTDVITDQYQQLKSAYMASQK